MNLINLGICIAIASLGIGLGAILIAAAIGVIKGNLTFGDDEK